MGFGGLSAEAGLTPSQTMVLAFTTWALPSAVVVVGAVLNDVPFYATVFAVVLASVRLMPMTMALIPFLKSSQTKTWHLVFASNFIAITAWVFAMRLVPELPREGRFAFFIGFAFTLAIINTCVAGLANYFSASLPPVASAALVFLTPIYFLLSMTAAARIKTEYWAIGAGLVLGPAFHLITPETDLLWCGLLGGSFAYLINLFGKRT